MRIPKRQKQNQTILFGPKSQAQVILRTAVSACWSTVLSNSTNLRLPALLSTAKKWFLDRSHRKTRQDKSCLERKTQLTRFRDARAPWEWRSCLIRLKISLHLIKLRFARRKCVTKHLRKSDLLSVPTAAAFREQALTKLWVNFSLSKTKMFNKIKIWFKQKLSF